MTTATERWVRRSSLVWRTAPGFLVVADISGEVVRAEGTAPDIWELLEQPRTTDELVDDLAAAYGVSADTVRHDLTTFLHDLVDRGLVDSVAARR